MSSPLFKGCHTYGETIGEALENIKEVIEICLGEIKFENPNSFAGYEEPELA